MPSLRSATRVDPAWEITPLARRSSTLARGSGPLPWTHQRASLDSCGVIEVTPTNPMNGQGDRVGLIWSIAELLRHDYKPSEYTPAESLRLRQRTRVAAPTRIDTSSVTFLALYVNRYRPTNLFSLIWSLRVVCEQNVTSYASGCFPSPLCSDHLIIIVIIIRYLPKVILREP
jgi:hypothetical protein